MDTTLATLRHDENSFYFYHSENWGEINTKHKGDAADPFKTLVWRKTRDEMHSRPTDWARRALSLDFARP